MKFLLTFICILFFSNATYGVISGVLKPAEREFIYKKFSSELKMQVDRLKAGDKKKYNDLLYQIRSIAVLYNFKIKDVVADFEISNSFAPMVHFFHGFGLEEKLMVVELSYLLKMSVKATYKAIFNLGIYSNFKDARLSLRELADKYKCTLSLNKITDSE